MIQRWPYTEIAQVIGDFLRAYGFIPEIRIREAGGYHEAIKKSQFDLAIQPYTLMTGDPDFFYAYWIESNAPRNCGWKNKEADRLIQEARHEMNPEHRITLYRQLETIFSKALPFLPLYNDFSLYAHRDSVAKFTMDHFFRPGIATCRRRPAIKKPDK